MAGQQALLNFLNQGKALPTMPVGGNGGAPPTQATPAARARQAAVKGQQAAQAQKQAAQQARQVQAQQRIQLQAQRQAQQGQQQAVDALQRQQRIAQGGIGLQQRQQRLNLDREREDRLQTNTLANAVEDVTGRAREAGNRLEGWAANVPTYGSVGLLLVVIFIFLWAIVPVNGGKTRAQLFWLTLTGRTKMADTPDAGGTYTDPGATTTGTGSGQAPTASNGHVQSFTDLLAQANIRDFGSSAV